MASASGPNSGVSQERSIAGLSGCSPVSNTQLWRSCLMRSIRSRNTFVGHYRSYLFVSAPYLFPRKSFHPFATRVSVSDTQATAAAQCLQATVMEDHHIFDTVALFTSYLRSPSIRLKMFASLSEFRDLEHAKALWHSHAWTSSIKSTSRSCAYFHTSPPDAPASQSTKHPHILPSKFVYYRCNARICCSQLSTRTNL